MSQRSRGPARIIGEVKPISDANKLLWERYYKPMQSAAAALNMAIRNTEGMLAAIIMEREGVSVETHAFDIDKLCIVPKPKGTGNGNA